MLCLHFQTYLLLIHQKDKHGLAYNDAVSHTMLVEFVYNGIMPPLTSNVPVFFQKSYIISVYITFAYFANSSCEATIHSYALKTGENGKGSNSHSQSIDSNHVTKDK